MKYVLKITLVLIALTIANSAFAQVRYFSKTAEISFFSSTAMEDIEAVSKSASTVIDVSSGKIQWAVLIKSFQFEKSLMQEHFNENYMESSEFPKAKFTGTMDNISSIAFTTDGTYEANITGDLTIHGETQSINTTASFIVSEGNITATTNLKVLLADYAIEIPAVVQNNISKEIEIKIKANYELFER